ncbi:MAG: hypothetical protein K2Z81_12380, partial [Cyanobacteria bacterium]|nr:hypothetical protein [Cyanobacteriota bacterium]
MPYVNKPNFVSDASLGELIHQIIDGLHQKGADITDDMHASLIKRCIAFCTDEPNSQISQATKKLSNLKLGLIEAIYLNPGILLDTPEKSVREIVKLHHQRSIEAAARAVTARAGQTAPAKKILTTSQYQVELSELMETEQLPLEGTLFRDHLSILYDGAPSLGNGLSSSDPGVEQFLHGALYAVRHGRIFSVSKGGHTVATFEYGPESQALRVSSGATLTFTSPIFPEICEALFELCKIVPVFTILGLPNIPKETLLTKEGQIVPITLEQISRSVAGNARLTAETPSEITNELCSRRCMTIEVEDATKVPRIVNAKLTIRSKVFEAPALESATDIDAPNVVSFIAPSLKRARAITAPEATVIDITNLVQAEDIDVRKATRFIAPSLERCRNLFTKGSDAFEIPVLRITHNLTAFPNDSFRAPLLEQAN